MLLSMLCGRENSGSLLGNCPSADISQTALPTTVVGIKSLIISCLRTLPNPFWPPSHRLALSPDRILAIRPPARSSGRGGADRFRRPCSCFGVVAFIRICGGWALHRYISIARVKIGTRRLLANVGLRQLGKRMLPASKDLTAEENVERGGLAGAATGAMMFGRMHEMMPHLVRRAAQAPPTRSDLIPGKSAMERHSGPPPGKAFIPASPMACAKSATHQSPAQPNMRLAHAVSSRDAHYSDRRASMGRTRAASQAGQRPKRIPTAQDTPRPRTTADEVMTVGQPA
jgi:hypothetical protein